MILSFYGLAFVFGTDAMDVPLSGQSGYVKTLYSMGIICQSFAMIPLVTMLHTGLRLQLQGMLSLLLSTAGVIMTWMSLVSFKSKKDIEEAKLTGHDQAVGSVATKALGDIMK